MGDATGQGPDGFHLLRLLKLCFKFMLLLFSLFAHGNIAQYALESEWPFMRAREEKDRLTKGAPK